MNIVVTSLKGGVGKSTVAQIIIATLDKAGKEFNFQDLDKQRSLTNCLSMAGLKASNDAPYTIIDTPPSVLDDCANEALKNADIVIVPTTTSVQDVVVTKEVIPFLKEQTQGKVMVLWNKFQRNTASGKVIDEYKDALPASSFNTTIGHRECFKQDFLVKGWSGLNKEAKEECTAFVLEVIA